MGDNLTFLFVESGKGATGKGATDHNLTTPQEIPLGCEVVISGILIASLQCFFSRSWNLVEFLKPVVTMSVTRNKNTSRVGKLKY